jgi:hypothetical protein
VNDSRLVSDLEQLVAATYLLWEPGWVTFNWREYTWDHVQRVRALAQTLALRESADADTLDLAALLHDVTKSYDGEYITDAAGQRVVDANGQWHNLLRLPVARNEATAAFDALGLAGTLHNVSGAEVARALMVRRGLPEPLCERVAGAIRDHLAPPADAPVESLCLYDADTIDANIGLPAFLRNIYIHLHFYEVRVPTPRPLDDMLQNAPLDYLRPYVTEKLKPWAQGKLRDFIPRLRTAAGRDLSVARLERLDATFDAFANELADPQSLVCGRLAVLLHYMRRRTCVSIASETRALAGEWLVHNGATEGAHSLVEAIARESAGLE